jgi:hypothetical protein
MCLNRPIDKIPEGQYAYLKNLRSYQEGLLEARSGITLLSNDFPNTGDPTEYIHSGYTLNDFEAIEHHRFVGFDSPTSPGELWWLLVGSPPQTATLIDNGFSGDPMSMIASAPVGAPVPWLYVYDSLKQAKYSRATCRRAPLRPIRLDCPCPTWLARAGSRHLASA